jgi:large subunit ribosomal protein L25
VTNFEIQAEARDGNGRTINRRLRRSGKVPAVVYGGGKDPESIVIEHSSLLREMNQPAFYTSILTIKIGSDAQSVFVKEVQRHPAKSQVIHLDFQRIVEDQAITLNVPIHFIGEEAAKGVKEQGGTVEHLATDLEISCLPRHLPEFIDVDVSMLELNQILHLSDLKLPEGVTLVALEHQQDLPVVTITPPRREETDAEDEGDEGQGNAAQS